jgi:MFS family permease
MAQEAVLTANPAVEISAPRLSTFHSLRYVDYRLLWFGQVGAAASNWMEQLARPLLILMLTDSAVMVGLLQATRMIPMLLVGVWAGVLADRMDKRRILLVTKTMVLGTHFSTALMILTGVVEPWMVFATTFVAGSAMAFDQPARQSLIPRLVPEEALANAVALNSAAMNVMRIGGASLAGLILVFMDLGDLYVIQSVIYLTVIYCTFRIRTRTNEEKKERGSMMAELFEGFTAVRHDKPILYILVLSLVLFVWGFPYQSVFVPLIAVQALDIGGSGAAMLVAVTGIGALAGSLTIATVGDRVRKRGLIMLGLIAVYSIGLLLFARAEIVLIAIPALIITGAMQTSFMSLNNAYVLGRAPIELHGRIMSLFSLDRGLIPLGATIGGFLAAALGPQDALTVMALLCIGCAGLMAFLIPALRRID